MLVAPNAFKGTLSAVEAARSIAAGLRLSMPGAEVREMPVSDGGQGFLETVLHAAGGKTVEVEVEGPLGGRVTARYGVIDGGSTAVIEMALASGITLVREHELDPMRASTYGTGELIRHAVDSGCEEVIVGLGGSATNDGGAGALQALGVRLLDAQGREIGRGGGELGRLDRVDARWLHPRMSRVRTMVACDVDNPLCGANGASAVYGPQKGATPATVKVLDDNLLRFAMAVRSAIGVDIRYLPGAGAAGGLGGGLAALPGTRLVPGFKLVAERLGLERAVEWADVVITGEGRLDCQSLRGKGPVGVGALARSHSVPVVAVVGRVEPTAWESAEELFDAVVVAGPPETGEDAKTSAGEALERAGRMVGMLMGIGGRTRGCCS
ncbi:MAG: glycerate kinase [Firmicutes bacterium]|nr:glycerate kinase [Bacillota bacterium]